MKLHNISIHPRHPLEDNQVMSGMNTIVEMDGKKLNGCTGVKVEIKARGVCKVTLEMFAHVNAELGKIETIIKKKKEKLCRN